MFRSGPAWAFKGEALKNKWYGRLAGITTSIKAMARFSIGIVMRTISIMYELALAISYVQVQPRIARREHIISTPLRQHATLQSTVEASVKFRREGGEGRYCTYVELAQDTDGCGQGDARFSGKRACLK